MHTALLSARKRTQTGELRAELSLGGRSVLGWQIRTVQALGCKRIICLCDAPTGEILDLQRQVEASGSEFHAIRTSLQLIALLRADDILIVLADGLVVDPDFAQSIAVDEGKLLKAVFVLPAGHELAQSHPDDFERIDASRGWAGLAIMRSANAQKLADLPPDSEAISLLLRLALQSRTETCPVAVNEGRVDNWVLATGSDAVDQHQRALVDQASEHISWIAPGIASSNSIARLVAPFGLDRGSLMSGAMALLLVTSGAVLTGFGYSVSGLALSALGAFSAAMSGAWQRLANGLRGRKSNYGRLQYFNALIDIALIISLIWSASFVPDVLNVLPIFALGLARLAHANAPPSIAPFWNDRAVQLAAFAICAVYGILSEALAVFGLAALLQVMLHQRREPVEIV